MYLTVLVTLQRFIPLIAPEAPTVLVHGAPEPRIYLRSGQLSSVFQKQHFQKSEYPLFCKLSGLFLNIFCSSTGGSPLTRFFEPTENEPC